MEGSLKYISSGEDDVVIGVNANDDIFIRQGISSTNPAGTSWVQVAGSLSVVDGYLSGVYWGVNSEEAIFHG